MAKTNLPRLVMGVHKPKNTSPPPPAAPPSPEQTTTSDSDSDSDSPTQEQLDTFKNIGDEEEEMFKVEAITGKMIVGEKVKYFVKWEGYDEDENTWECTEDINAPELIQQFEEEQKRKEEQNRSIECEVINVIKDDGGKAKYIVRFKNGNIKTLHEEDKPHIENQLIKFYEEKLASFEKYFINQSRYFGQKMEGMKEEHQKEIQKMTNYFKDHLIFMKESSDILLTKLEGFNHNQK